MERNSIQDRARLIRLRHPKVLLEHEVIERKEAERAVQRLREEKAKEDIEHVHLIELAAKRSLQVANITYL